MKKKTLAKIKNENLEGFRSLLNYPKSQKLIPSGSNDIYGIFIYLNIKKNIYVFSLNLPFISKVLEGAIKEQMSQHLLSNGLLPELQSAYRLSHSMETALLKVTSDALIAADQGELPYITAYKSNYLGQNIISEDRG